MRPILMAVIAAVAAVAASFALATAASSPTPSATDRTTLKKLKALDRSVKALRQAVGVAPLLGLRGEVDGLSTEVQRMDFDLDWIRSELEKLCRAVDCYP